MLVGLLLSYIYGDSCKHIAPGVMVQNAFTNNDIHAVLDAAPKYEETQYPGFWTDTSKNLDYIGFNGDIYIPKLSGYKVYGTQSVLAKIELASFNALHIFIKKYYANPDDIAKTINTYFMDMLRNWIILEKKPFVSPLDWCTPDQKMLDSVLEKCNTQKVMMYACEKKVRIPDPFTFLPFPPASPNSAIKDFHDLLDGIHKEIENQTRSLSHTPKKNTEDIIKEKVQEYRSAREGAPAPAPKPGDHDRAKSPPPKRSGGLAADGGGGRPPAPEVDAIEKQIKDILEKAKQAINAKTTDLEKLNAAEAIMAEGFKKNLFVTKNMEKLGFEFEDIHNNADNFLCDPKALITKILDVKNSGADTTKYQRLSFLKLSIKGVDYQAGNAYQAHAKRHRDLENKNPRAYLYYVTKEDMNALDAARTEVSTRFEDMKKLCQNDSVYKNDVIKNLLDQFIKISETNKDKISNDLYNLKNTKYILNLFKSQPKDSYTWVDPWWAKKKKDAINNFYNAYISTYTELKNAKSLDEFKAQAKAIYKKEALKLHPDKHATKSLEERKEVENQFKKLAQLYEAVDKMDEK